MEVNQLQGILTTPDSSAFDRVVEPMVFVSAGLKRTVAVVVMVEREIVLLCL